MEKISELGAMTLKDLSPKVERVVRGTLSKSLQKELKA